MCWREECWGRGREADWIGHVLRGGGLLRDVLEGRMLGKRPQGRPRRGMIDDLMEGSFVKMKRRAERRKEWREWVPGTCLRAEHLLMMMMMMITCRDCCVSHLFIDPLDD